MLMFNTLYLLKMLGQGKISTEKKIAAYILENPSRVISMNITKLAQLSDTSSAAIVRLCKKLGFKGFQDFRLSVAKEFYTKQYAKHQRTESSLNYNGDSTVVDIISNILDVCTDAIKKIDKLINRNNIEITVEKIRKCRSILIAGAGASNIVGKDLHQKLCRLGYLSAFSEDTDLQTIMACTLTSKDILIAISYSGEHRQIIKTIQEAKKNLVYVIAITRFKNSMVVKLADTVLYVPDTESLYREGASVSRLCQLIVVDFIYSSLIVDDFEKSVKLLDKTWRSLEHKVTE